ncbi:hypothetical protein SD80_012600 [Scytonema tolypothrichoides VB-61278]|nr:hypothetical protein SD80_012600 [Scytonema tolypothrichoides VB-61278]
METLNPGTIKVRNLEPWVIPCLHQQAQASGFKTLEGFVRQLLLSQALKPQQDFVQKIRQHLAETEQKHGLLPEGFTDKLIREVRDERE